MYFAAIPAHFPGAWAEASPAALWAHLVVWMVSAHAVGLTTSHPEPCDEIEVGADGSRGIFRSSERAGTSPKGA